MKKRQYKVKAANLDGEDETFYLPIDKKVENAFQKNARDERSTEEILNEDGELMPLRSFCFRVIQ